MKNIKLISLNLAIKKDNTEKVINFLLEQNADIVCLQEVCDHKEESVGEVFRVKQKIDDALGSKYPHRHFAPLFMTKSFSVFDFGGYIEQGNYILSKFPILHSSNDFFHRQYYKVKDWAKEINFKVLDSGRSLQTVTLDMDATPLRVMNIHGVWTADKMGDERTINECNFIIEKFAEEDMPTILAGDLNLLPDSEGIKILNKKLENLILENSYKSTRPDFKDEIDEGNNIVDYIFINDNLKPNNFQVLDVAVSDHLPLVCEFEIN